MFKKSRFAPYFLLALMPLNALAAVCTAPNGDTFTMTLDPATAIAGKPGIVIVGQHKEIKRYSYSSYRPTGVLTYQAADEQGPPRGPLSTISVSNDFKKITIRVGENESGPEFEDLVCK
jgi:hypothetical protein